MWGQLVSQRDATEKLAHQVPAQTSIAHRRIKAATGDAHAKEKDEAHKSSKGHVSEPPFECPISLESLAQRASEPGLNMEDQDTTEDISFRSLQKRRTKSQSKQKQGFNTCYGNEESITEIYPT
ncbi:hypothetical protein MATL_G00019840 [Megalops atlanticus]|uniref:Uncharacterized protein n=1 Tax=Megalops atlanticus TaxID=7932 RepID=A0A9D3QHV1_MEGAT|nr:hypothetical protein MATL_G00019840 [Megalops atlanticus]